MSVVISELENLLSASIDNMNEHIDYLISEAKTIFFPTHPMFYRQGRNQDLSLIHI